MVPISHIKPWFRRLGIYSALFITNVHVTEFLICNLYSTKIKNLYVIIDNNTQCYSNIHFYLHLSCHILVKK